MSSEREQWREGSAPPAPPAHSVQPRDEGRQTGRLEAFSDGVFAIAITLLILSIPVPSPPLLAGLQQNGTAFAAYAISFATILIMWVNHHSVFKQVARIDRPFQIVNGLLLMAVTFLNYPTELIAQYLKNKNLSAELLVAPNLTTLGSDEPRLAILIYTGTMLVVAVLFNALWFYAASGGRLLAPNADVRVVRAISRAFRLGPLYYIVTFAIAFFSPAAALIASAALAVYYAVFGRDAL